MGLQRTLTVSREPKGEQQESLDKYKMVVKGVFRQLDCNGEGFVDRDGVRVALQALLLPSSPEHVEELFKTFDTNRDGVIHFAEFEALALRQRQQLEDVFDHLDHNDDGFIHEADIRRALDQLNITASDAQISRLFKRADLDHDGKISLKEFQHFLLLATPASIQEVFDYWAHASAIDIGETMAAPDNFLSSGQAAVTFVSGAIAGAVSRTATAPFDRIKTLFQSGKAKGTILESVHKINTKEGLRAFWNGNGTNVIKIMPESAIRFLSYEVFKGALCKDPDEVTIGERFVAGAMAGSVSQFAIYPLEIAKTRLAVARRGEYQGIGDCLVRILRYIKAGSMQGVNPHGDNSYGAKRICFTQLPKNQEGPGVMTLLAFGAVSSTCGQLVAYPLQLIRTKLQAQGMRGVPYVYTGTWDCFRRTVKHQGFRGLYRGLGPNFLKALPSIAISYAVFEKARTKLSTFVRSHRTGASLIGGE